MAPKKEIKEEPNNDDVWSMATLPAVICLDQSHAQHTPMPPLVAALGLYCWPRMQISLARCLLLQLEEWRLFLGIRMSEMR